MKEKKKIELCLCKWPRCLFGEYACN